MKVIEVNAHQLTISDIYGLLPGKGFFYENGILNPVELHIYGIANALPEVKYAIMHSMRMEHYIPYVGALHKNTTIKIKVK